jgi:hypothetical protein
LWASDRYALLVVLQAMDAAGKDSVIKHVMHDVNPQGVQVVSLKKPSSEELGHDFLWRISRALPERGRIGIFNRSHYEEVVALKVHSEWREPSTRLRTTSNATKIAVGTSPMTKLTAVTATSIRFIGSRSCASAIADTDGGFSPLIRLGPYCASRGGGPVDGSRPGARRVASPGRGDPSGRRI